ncbi:MAG: electron transfer flavoprotein subunit beta/FixA family protein [Candidatus Obscuribacterales bacterium]|nr:electron transfer flavoprotein subunit beta/FixA family protein [Candidatus Obscuribacterales bacterium]
MKIAVCIKAVPDTETKITVAADKKGIDTTGVRFVTSPFDEFAIEEALQLKQKHGGDTFVFSMGGAECTDVLRDALARGIDNAVHLQDAAFANLDPLSTAKVLAAGIKDGGFDVILLGQQGVGGDNSQVPAMLAELLDLPQVTVITKLEIADGKFKAQREIEGAHETVEGTLPVVLSAQKGLNEPRYPGIKGVMAARRKEIAVKNAEALGISGKVGADHASMNLAEMATPPERPQGRLIEGDTDTQVKTLVQLLKTEAQVI